MLRQRLSENSSKSPYYYTTPRSRMHKLKEEEPILSEKRLAVFGLVFSLIIITGKIFISYRDTIESAILEQKLVSYETITEDGQVMFMYAWKTAVKYSKFWLPALCGLLSSYFTWIMVYLDSNVPGVQPPSPLSPKKYKDQSGHTFHLNYIFAVLVGIFVFIYMYFRGVAIEY